MNPEKRPGPSARRQPGDDAGAQESYQLQLFPGKLESDTPEPDTPTRQYEGFPYAKPKTTLSSAPHNGTTTSKTAAKRARSWANSWRSRVLVCVVRRGNDGATDEEIQRELGIRVQTETPRRRELVQARLVVDSGRRRCTSSGCPAIVWVATLDGIAQATPV